MFGRIIKIEYFYIKTIIKKCLENILKFYIEKQKQKIKRL